MEQGIINVLTSVALLGLLYIIFKVKHENERKTNQLICKICILEAKLNKNKWNDKENEHTESDNKTQTLVKYAILHDYIESK